MHWHICWASLSKWFNVLFCFCFQFKHVLWITLYVSISSMPLLSLLLLIFDMYFSVIAGLLVFCLQIIAFLIPLLDDKFPLIRSITCWTLSRFSKYIVQVNINCTRKHCLINTAFLLLFICDAQESCLSMPLSCLFYLFDAYHRISLFCFLYSRKISSFGAYFSFLVFCSCKMITIMWANAIISLIDNHFLLRKYVD